MSSLEALSRNQVVKEHVPSEMLSKCSALADKYSIEVKRFAAHLDAYLINQEINVLSLDQMGKFEQFLHAENKKDTASRNAAVASKAKNQNENVKRPFEADNADGSPSKMSKKGDSIVVGESPGFSQNSMMASQGGETYDQRKGRGEPVLTNPPNKNLGVRGEFVASDLQPLGMRSRITCRDEDFDNCKERFRYMFTTADQRSSELEKQLVHMRKHMCEKISLDMSELHSVNEPSQTPVWVCGRIVCEASEGKINKESVMLEGSRRDSRFLVKLDLSEVQAFSLFPGQVVLVQGINSNGKKIVAKRLVEGIPLDTAKTSPERLLEFHHSKMYQGGQALKVIAAAGPFTTSDSLNYEPFNDILSRVIRDKPDVLVLTGPFVDVTQPLLAKGDVMLPVEDEDSMATSAMYGASYEVVFIKKIIELLWGLFNEEDDGTVITTNIILVPSLKDGHHECVFPQPPFGDRDRITSDIFDGSDLGVLDVPFSKDGDVRKRVHLMPNPCVFRVNEVVFGVTSNDTLFSLSSDEVSQNIGGRLERLAGHMLQQHSFAPQFPAPVNALAQLDMRYARHWQMKVSPDVLIAPSKLTHMARDVLGTLLVNPGTLTKGVNGGTYAELNIHPMGEQELRDAVLSDKKEEPLKHDVASRTYTNIMKI